MLAWHFDPSDEDSVLRCIMLHGFLGSARDWQLVAGRLSSQWPVACMDLPGHGQSHPVTARNWEELATQFHQDCDSHGITRAHLVGYSMGGRLALYLALREPQRYAALVLESASPGLRREVEAAQRLAADCAVADALEQTVVDPEPEEAFRAFLNSWYEQAIFGTHRKDPLATERLIEQRLDNDPVHLAEGLRLLSVGAQPGLWEQLPALQVPTLLIVGEEDRKFRRIAEEMCEACPNMAMEVFSGCSHNVHWENPEGYTTAVKAFLQAAS